MICSSKSTLTFLSPPPPSWRCHLTCMFGERHIYWPAVLGGSSPEPTSCTRMTQPVVSVPEQKPRPVCMELTKGSERGSRRPWPPRPSEYSSSPARCCHLRPLALDSSSHRAVAASRLHRPSSSSTWPFPIGHKKIGCFHWEEEGDPHLALPRLASNMLHMAGHA